MRTGVALTKLILVAGAPDTLKVLETTVAPRVLAEISTDLPLQPWVLWAVPGASVAE